MFPDWYKVTMLGLEAQQVVWLRMMKMALGGAAAQAEMQLMVREKSLAAVEASAQLMAGRSADHVVAGYRRKVRANARRLLK